MPSFHVDVEPSVLIWARRTAGLSQEEAAKRIGVALTDVMAWEVGAEDAYFARLTFARLRKIARVYRRPVPVFYLEKPPTDFKVPKDFRRLPEAERGAWSRTLHFELRRISAQREGAIELARLTGDEPSTVDLRITLSQDPEVAGQSIRHWLGVTVGHRARQGREAFAHWVDRVEDKGILVAQIRGVPLEELRGCSISEQPFPIVAVNAGDSYGGRSFTLLHEVAHVLLHDGGLCDLEDTSLGEDLARMRVERFCNRVAAAALMPREAVLQDPVIVQIHSPAYWSDSDLRRLSRRFGVSEEAALLRLVTLGRATQGHYEERRAAFRKAYEALRERQKQLAGSPRVPVAQLRLSELGRRYVIEAIDAYERREINSSDLADYLGMKLDHLPQLVDLVRSRP